MDYDTESGDNTAEPLIKISDTGDSKEEKLDQPPALAPPPVMAGKSNTADASKASNLAPPPV